MRVIVIGSGLIGVTTAVLLRLRGYEVIVIERRPGPAQEASFANGGLLTPSMAQPWNTPGCWRELLRSLGRSDTALQLHLRALPSMASWGISFLRNSSPAICQRSASNNLRLALQSLQAMESLRRLTCIEYGRATQGSMRLFRDLQAFDEAAAAADRLRAEGLRCHVLSIKETIDLEPALAPIATQLKGSIHYQDDEIGDARKFCVELAAYARKLGVEFRFDAEVTALETSAGQVTAAVTAGERWTADRYIVTAASYSALLLRPIGVRVPVYPAKGYSLTVEAPVNCGRLSIAVIDDELHAAVVPLGGVIRVAGTAEFAGYDLTLQPSRLRNLTMLLQRLFPEVDFDAAAAEPWCGLRAMSADGVPIVGPTALSNLYVNTGHGHLGWTMAAGSAQLLCELVAGDSPSIDPAPFALARFAS